MVRLLVSDKEGAYVCELSLLERPLIAPDDFNVTILSAFSLPHPSFQSDCLGAIHLPPGCSLAFRFTQL
nr:MAG TPA: hypothetical protein [Caudoviricetes sp.]